MTGYRYCQRWNFKMSEVILQEPFLDPAEAQARYEAHKDWFTIVADVPQIGERGVVPPVVIEVMVAAPDFKVFYLNPAGKHRRVSLLRNIDGRLFLNDVTDYGDDEPLNEIGTGTIVDTVMNPDGSGRTITRTNVPGQPRRHQEVVHFSDANVDGLWMDVPEFGDWDRMVQLGDPQP
jgi:hypothetical protein